MSFITMLMRCVHERGERKREYTDTYNISESGDFHYDVRRRNYDVISDVTVLLSSILVLS